MDSLKRMKETKEEREKRANKLKKKLIKQFCEYFDFGLNSEQAGDLDHALTMMRNELL